MVRYFPIISFVFLCMFSCVIVLVVISPVHAGESIVGNVKETAKTVTRDTRDDNVQGGRQQEFITTKGPEFITTKGLEYITTKKDPKPQGAGFIRLKPKFESDNVADYRKVFDVEFSNETLRQKTKKDSDGGPYMKFERIEDPEKDNILVRKATEKDYKTELSMGYKMSPYSEVYLGKGFLVDRKDDFNVDTRDNGWRLKFKFNF